MCYKSTNYFRGYKTFSYFCTNLKGTMRHFFIIIVCTMLLMACGADNNRPVTGHEYDEEDSTLLRVAVTPTLDCLPLFLASDHDFFGREGVAVVLREYQAQMDQDTAIERGRADILTTDLVRVERMKQRGTALNYLAATNLSWQLYSKKMARIKRLEQLDDKMLAMTRYSATALLADLVVDSARLEPERVFRIQVNDIGVRLNMLETDIMDALLLPEPQATRARLLGSVLLLDSRTLDLNLGVMAVRQDFMDDEKRQAQVDAFMKAYTAACDSINTYGVAYYESLIERFCNVRGVADSLPDNLKYDAAQMPRQQDIDQARRWLNQH